MDKLLEPLIAELMPLLVPDREGDQDGSVLCFRAGRAVLIASRLNHWVTLDGIRGEISHELWEDLNAIYDNENEKEKQVC